MAPSKLTIVNEDERSINSDSDIESAIDNSGDEHTTTREGQTESQTSKSQQEIAAEESRIIFWLRSLTLTVLFLAAVGVCIAVWSTTTQAEHEEYENNFEGSASKIITSFEDIVDHKLTAVGSLSVAFTSFVRSQPEMEWPFVTINDFQQRSLTTQENSGSLFTRIIPKVTLQQREEWERYSVEHIDWLFEAQEYNREHGIGYDRLLQSTNNTAGAEGPLPEEEVPYGTLDFSAGVSDKIYMFDENFAPVPDVKHDFYLPLWQESPTFNRDMTNWNTHYYPDYAPYVYKSIETGEMSIGGIDTASPGEVDDPDLSTSYFALLLSIDAGKRITYNGEPMSSVFVPVFDTFDKEERSVVAILFAVFKWASYFEGLLPDNNPGVTVVLENNCDGPFTYLVKGHSAEFIGQGDLHDTSFDDMERQVDFGSSEVESGGFKLNQDLCSYSLRVYPTQALYDEYNTYMPYLITVVVAVVFMFTVVVFLGFNFVVEQRQRKVYAQAERTTAIVSSLFPEAVRDRLMNTELDEGGFTSRKSRLHKFLDEGDTAADDTQPIADLFPNSTVFFADISGFTAWSSTRDPTQVFILLQTIYQAFDVIAKRRKVFKVETIGDSYVAACGLPSPDTKHFITMSRFATDCLTKFKVLVKELEAKLGPDTGDLDLRIGVHSGPVTAGVLKGERSRFQLFGDTVNTASRMESSGVPGKVQVSFSTAQLLKDAGKEHWLHRREDAVVAKGKGVLETYFLFPKNKKGSSLSSRSDNGATDQQESITSTSKTSPSVSQKDPSSNNMRQDRLVDWIVEQLLRRVKKVLARHEALGMVPEPAEKLMYKLPVGKTSLDEVLDVIPMPKYDSKTACKSMTADVDPIVAVQLKKVVTTIAYMYNDNPFHNFEHACHVAMSVDKFLTRIVAPEIDEKQAQTFENERDLQSKLHDYTHGITSDPMVLFAIVFSALIHDADHRGVSNPQLAKEEVDMANMYNNKSVAEQNSVDICWDLLMEDEYKELRSHIFKTRKEMMRFRQVVVNVVLATDIFDKEFNDLRKKRWNEAFNEKKDDNDLRATIVIEHIIQASDVSHTMQHWHIYRKWNERLFMEMFAAFKEGRMAKNPADFWYLGEIGFFDNYVIPLAKKLDQCGVFGVSSDECLNYAMQNRKEWEQRGQEVLQSLIEKAEPRDPTKWIAPSKPKTEQERMAALRKLEMLDTPAEERFDRITRMCTSVFDVPLAFVTLVDENRQWFKSAQWLCSGDAPTETPREVSFCGHAILGSDLFIIPDATKDERFAGNPLVVGGPEIRFYAGCPILVGEHNIGTLCIIDQRPRDLDETQKKLLWEFGAMVKAEFMSSQQKALSGKQATSPLNALADNPAMEEISQE